MKILKHEYYSPKIKEYLSNNTELNAIGDLSILKNETLGLISSRKCPGSVILQFFDMLGKWRSEEITLISGFHSPLEQEALKSLRQSRTKFIFCPARSIEKMRIKKDHQDLIEQKRLLILSPFPKEETRQTAKLANQRNKFVANIATRLLIIHASEKSQTEKLASKMPEFWTLDNSANENLLRLGGKEYNLE
ncbi:MAG: DNA-processing protein DprA [Acidobacteriota bacterium]|jgi:predicted Rossmann fold nucleotide-binding protein DprA/Smf involved in DNA uptake|nr:DNA-processing protein DprA [Acidobacteriota bacterium]